MKHVWTFLLSIINAMNPYSKSLRRESSSPTCHGSHRRLALLFPTPATHTKSAAPAGTSYSTRVTHSSRGNNTEPPHNAETVLTCREALIGSPD